MNIKMYVLFFVSSLTMLGMGFSACAGRYFQFPYFQKTKTESLKPDSVLPKKQEEFGQEEVPDPVASANENEECSSNLWEFIKRNESHPLVYIPTYLTVGVLGVSYDLLIRKIVSSL